MSITQEMQCSDLALLNNCAVHNFFASVLLILICVIMWAAEQKRLVSNSCILHKAGEMSHGARKIKQVGHEEKGE